MPSSVTSTTRQIGSTEERTRTNLARFSPLRRRIAFEIAFRSATEMGIVSLIVHALVPGYLFIIAGALAGVIAGMLIE